MNRHVKLTRSRVKQLLTTARRTRILVVVVGKVGTATVTPAELLASFK